MFLILSPMNMETYNLLYPDLVFNAQEKENELFGNSDYTIGPLTNEMMLLFVNVEKLNKFYFDDSIQEFQIVENLEFENKLFEGEFPIMKFWKPVKYFYFHPDDKEWVFNYLGLSEMV